jgi:AcrR family transcriptional regulator
MTKTGILEKALELFATKGYFNCSMDDISQAVNIKKPSLYFHFPSKESIFQAVFDRILENYESFINEITAVEGDKSSLEILSGIFRKYMINCTDNLEMEFWDRYYYYPPEQFEEELHNKTLAVEMDFMDRILKVVEAGIRKKEIKPLDAHSITAAFYYMMIGLGMSARFYTGEQIDEEISRCLDVFLAGIKA